MTELRTSENLDAIVEAALRRQEQERRVLEEQRAAAARAAAYRENGTWDDADWWAMQLGRAPSVREIAPQL